jgi:Peptidase family M28
MTRGTSRSRHRTFALSVVLILIGAIIVAGQRAGRSLGAGTPQRKPATLNDPEVVRRYQNLITPEGLAARLYFFASDLFEGRETTTRGQKLAAEYLASQYRQLGLTPRGTKKTTDPLSPSTYFQSFAVYRRTPKLSRLDVSINGDKIASSTFSSERHDDLSFFSSGALTGAAGGVVFAGYGIADDRLGYNDYTALAAKGISLSDKWVLILEDEPLLDGSTSLFPTIDHKPSSWSTQFFNKRRALLDAGRPKGMLVVSDLSLRTPGTFADRAAQASRNAQRLGPLSLTQSPSFPPTFAISSKLANQLLASSSQTIEDLQKQINQTLKPTVFALNDIVRVSATVKPYDGLTTENVLAFIEGSDPLLKDEVLIISAHYDHLGINSLLKDDQIFNGAADDGSGVVASLEMAQGFIKAKRDGFGPRRSILFINFTGEEKGLLGSGHYSVQPVVPWDKTVADINMDGVAGIDPTHPTHSKNYIYILGAEELSDELIDSATRINRTTGINLELTRNQGFSSDQYNFETQLVPYIYFSTGLTEKYHQPADEPETIAYDHFARVVQLVFATAWQVANQDARIRSTDRNRLTLVGYTCPPCPFACDTAVYPSPGECPVCGMNLVPKYRKPS